MSTVKWIVRFAAFLICIGFAARMWIGTSKDQDFSEALGVPVTRVSGETNQFIVHAAPGSVDFESIGTVHLDLGYAVGVTLPGGTQVGFRYEPESAFPLTRDHIRPSMQLILIGAVYLALHFTVFALLLRHLESFQSERGILRYHAISAAMVVLLAVAMIRRDPSVTASAVAIVALHGLYSVSFLELWSLAQGGYSLAILREVSGGQTDFRDVDRVMHGLGVHKTELRVESLQRLNIVRNKAGHIELTLFGRAVSAVQVALLNVTGARVRE